MVNRKKGAEKIDRPPTKTTPTGVSPVFSRTARFRRETTRQLLDHFFLWGYREIILPSFEYLDAISPGLPPALLTKLYLMQDRGSGKVLVLRPDATAQIGVIHIAAQICVVHSVMTSFVYLGVSAYVEVKRQNRIKVGER